jgi:hypothetical protein
VDSEMLKEIMKANDGNMFLKLMQELAPKRHHKWIQWCMFRLAFVGLEVDVCKEIVKFLINVGADLNFQLHNSGDGTCPCKIIDVAARRGDLTLIRILVERDATPTADTLVGAISSGNLELIEFLLDNTTCSTKDTRTPGVTPALQSLNPTLSEAHGSIFSINPTFPPQHHQCATWIHSVLSRFRR